MKRAQRLLALVLAMTLLLGSGAQAVPRTLDVGETVTVIVSKLNPFDRTPEAAVDRMGGSVGQELPIVDGFAADVPVESVDDLAEVANVRGLTLNSQVRVEGQYGENSGVASAVYTDVSRASKAWTHGTTGKGITVAVIDTGVDVSGDLAGRVIGAADFSGENAPYTDSYGHGTFVAGLIAGTGAGNSGIKGVAPDAKIFSVKIAGKDGTTDLFRLLAALEFVAIHKDAFGIRVLNLSLGTDSKQSYKVDPLNFAVERVWNSGITVVVAAGNTGRILKPADDPLVVTVGAVDDKTTVGRTDDAVASFSGVGPTLSDGLAKPDVIASGRSVVSSRAPGSTIETNFPNAVIGDRYFKGSGTSASSAVVAGAAALVIQQNWSLSPNQVKQRLVSASKPVTGANAMQQGAGSIDAYNAVISLDTTAANQGVVLSGGGGSFQGSSGSGCFRNADGVCYTDAEVAAGTGFDEAAFYGSTWGGSTWSGSTWSGSTWSNSQWNGSTWSGSTWSGSTWSGSTWSGSTWSGSTWSGSTWSGSTWSGSTWSGSTWSAADWAAQEWLKSSWMGSTWSGSTWSGSTWSGSTWSGSTWSGSTWSGSTWSGSTWSAGSTWSSELSWLGTHWT